jgi:hypothetical protein
VKVTATLLLRCNAPLQIVVDVVDIKIMTSVPHQLYESCSDQDLRLHAQDECADLPSGNLLDAPIESGCIRYSGCIHGMDGDHRELLIRRAYYRSRAWLSAGVYASDYHFRFSE